MGVGVSLGAALVLTWLRLLRGGDLVDEAFSVLVPWRWALGDRPFVDEQNLSQSFALVPYPFVKVFAWLGGNDVSGLVLFDRHLFLGLGVLTAACVALLARRSLPGVLAVLVAAPFVSVVLFETPQITANTLCALLLSAGAALGAVTVLGGPRAYALAAGVAFGLAGVAYPTVLLLAPFVAVLLAFSTGERLIQPPLAPDTPRGDADGPLASGRQAWRLLSAWALGGVLVVAPLGAAVFVTAGATNLRRSWDYTLSLARDLDQLGGTSKAGGIFADFLSLLGHQWYIVAVALLALGVLRVRPAAGRWLLLLTPPAVWLTGTTSAFGAAGAVIVYALAAPYLYLFLPGPRREDGMRLLLCVWAPALLIGAMTAYTSADGFVRAAVGLLSGVVVSGLFLAWGLQPLGRARRGGSWIAAAGLMAIVAATLSFQVQFQVGGVRWSDLDTKMDDGPWRGIALTARQGRLLDAFSADLAQTARPGDDVLVFPQGAAFYLYWPGGIAANTSQLYVDESTGELPKATVSYYRRHRRAPTLVVRLAPSIGVLRMTSRDDCGALGYPQVRTAPDYTFCRKPDTVTLDEVLERLPRL